MIGKMMKCEGRDIAVHVEPCQNCHGLRVVMAAWFEARDLSPAAIAADGIQGFEPDDPVYADWSFCVEPGDNSAGASKRARMPDARAAALAAADDARIAKFVRRITNPEAKTH